MQVVIAAAIIITPSPCRGLSQLRIAELERGVNVSEPAPNACYLLSLLDFATHPHPIPKPLNEAV